MTPYGTWPSPLSAADVAAGSPRLEVVACGADSVYWIERRPTEAGRTVLVRRTRDGDAVDVTPPGTNVRTRVNEYGGGACLVAGETVLYSEFADQRLYRLDPGADPRPVTPSGPWCYADAAMHPSGRWLVCVREDHSPAGEPITTIVGIPLDGITTAGEILRSGADFYSTPRFSPDGTRVCWLEWRHPQMPWDGTELWMADVAADGTLSGPRAIAGGPDESIVQPGWSPDGVLYFVSDRTGWWNLYRVSWIVDRESTTHDRRPTTHDPRSTIHDSRSTIHEIEPLHPMAAEFARPQWVFGMSTWAFADPARMVVSFHHESRWRVATLDVVTGDFRAWPIDREPRDVLLATPTHAVFVGSSSDATDAVVMLDLQSGKIDMVHAAAELHLDAACVSEAQAIEFPTEGGQSAHAFYYAPRNPNADAPPAEHPPAIVVSHGGPTSAATSGRDLEIQYWTTRGFAVIDVDYGGSSGYGRAYRQRLHGQWGIVDVADCVNAAKHLVDRGLADPARLIIRGRSAGGYTTLAALTFRPGVFAAGGSYYGVSDLEALATDTHKFEARYMDTLVGPYPAMRDVYRERSPIHFVDRISCPLILLQGLEDKVVPPNQAQTMADAVRAKGLPVALVLFPGEQHGFRRAENIVRSLEAELAFYGAVCGFTPAGALPAVPIDNLRTTM